MRASEVAVLSTMLCQACGPSLPGPAKVEHPPSAFSIVPYPPPAALAEVVSERPDRSRAVWLDGDWVFRGRRYAWRRGGWYEPRDEVAYAPSRVVFESDGRVLFAPGGWYDSRRAPLDDIRPITPAAIPKNEFTAETQAAR